MIQKEVGNKIKQLRLRNDMTLEQLGERLGVSKAYVHHMENGNRKISLDFLEIVADIFDVEVYYFFTDHKLVKLTDEEVVVLERKKKWDEYNISLDEIEMWVDIARSRKK